MSGFPEPPASCPVPGVVEHARGSSAVSAWLRRGIHSIWWAQQPVAEATHPTAWAAHHDRKTTYQ